MRRSFALALIAALALSIAAPAGARKGKASVHKPPYKKGAQGGDEWNYVSADPQTGEVDVFRAFPGISPVVGCTPEPSAGWATLRQPHEVHGRTDTVTINFDGVFEAYAWVYGVVNDSHGRSIGLEKFQGPHAGAGKLKIKLFRTPENGSEIEVEFGAQLGDACPQVGGAHVTFSSIKID